MEKLKEAIVRATDKNLSIVVLQIEDAKDLEAKLQVAVEALEFYGETKNWYPHVCDKWSGMNTAFAEENDPDNDVEIVNDNFAGGKRAREALEKIKAK